VERLWLIDIMRVDGARPPGNHPFQVEIQGALENFKLEDLGGVYQVSTTPTDEGAVRVYIKLFGKDIIGSPVTMEVTQAPFTHGDDPNSGVRQSRNRGVPGAVKSPARNPGPPVVISSPSAVQSRSRITSVTIVTPRSADDALADLLDELEQY